MRDVAGTNAMGTEDSSQSLNLGGLVNAGKVIVNTLIRKKRPKMLVLGKTIWRKTTVATRMEKTQSGVTPQILIRNGKSVNHLVNVSKLIKSIWGF